MTELDELRDHWGDAYEISHEAGWFTAARRDNGKSMTARTATDLRYMIRDDYSRRPISREVAP